MKVVWTDRAKKRLKDIEEYIAQDSEQAAKKEVEKILRRSVKLAEPPDVGHPLEHDKFTDLREVLVRPYRLIYRIRPTQIDIITVLHYRQLLPQDLKRLKH